MIKITDKTLCAGCSSCVNACPRSCISMERDEEGFRYPTVNTSSCINCGICENVCPLLHPVDTKDQSAKAAYVARNRKPEILSESSSGGFFFGICEYVMSLNGVVYGAGFDQDFNVCHLRAEKIEECRQFMGSKYVQSRIGKTYQEVKADLNQGRVVLFSGTPCQVQGLMTYLNRNSYPNLILVDLICHGVGSEAVWDSYLESEKKRNNSKLNNISFRSKKYGYQNFAMKLSFDNKTTYKTSRTDQYLRAFTTNLILRPSCYTCHFKSVFHISDLTIYDGWDSHTVIGKKDDNKGYTNVLVQSEKGLDIIKKLETFLELYPVSINDIVPNGGGMILKSASKHPSRDAFFDTVSGSGVDQAFDSFLKITPKDLLIERIKILNSSFIWFRQLTRIKRNITRKR